MSDLVERLQHSSGPVCGGLGELCAKAAVEIQMLRAENNALYTSWANAARARDIAEAKLDTANTEIAKQPDAIARKRAEGMARTVNEIGPRARAAMRRIAVADADEDPIRVYVRENIHADAEKLEAHILEVAVCLQRALARHDVQIEDGVALAVAKEIRE